MREPLEVPPINKTDSFIAPFISETGFIEHPLCFKHSLGRCGEDRSFPT